MTTTDLDRQLSAWLRQSEPVRAPDDLLARTVAVTRRTRQRRGFVARVSAAAAARPWQAWRLAPYAGLILLTALLAAAMLAVAVIGTQPRPPAASGWATLPPVADAVEGSTHVTDVVAGGPGVIAIGNSLSNGADGCRVGRAHAWTSADGATWRAVATLANAHFERAVVGQDRLYVVGYADWRYEPTADGCGWGHGRRAAWSTIDGVAWQALPELPGEDGSYMTTAAEANGALVGFVVRQELRANGQSTQMTEVWRATDTGWQRAATLDGAVIVHAAAHANSLVAVGYVDAEQQTARAWASVDGGATWRGGERFGPAVQLHALAAGPAGVVVVGSRSERGQPAVPIVATTSDGVDWEVTTREGSELVSLAPIDGGFIAASSEQVDADEPTTCPPPALPSPTARATVSGPPAVMLPTPIVEPSSTGGCVAMRELADVWLSADGVEWRQGAVLPAVEHQLVADPLPAPGFRFAPAGSGVVVANPYFGARVWLIAADTSD